MEQLAANIQVETWLIGEVVLAIIMLVSVAVAISRRIWSRQGFRYLNRISDERVIVSDDIVVAFHPSCAQQRRNLLRDGERHGARTQDGTEA